MSLPIAVATVLLLTVVAAPGVSALPSLAATSAYAQGSAVLGSEVPVPPSAVPLIVGQATLTAFAKAQGASGAIPIASYADFETYVADPSPALAAAVATFYALGGGDFWIQLTPDESATSLVHALTSTTPGAGTFTLVVVPSLGQLSGNDYQQVAIAATRRAHSALALAILDPPDRWWPATATSPR